MLSTTRMSERDYGPFPSAKRHLFEATPTKASVGCSVDYSAVRRSPSNKWTFEQRVTLCTLVQFYDLTGVEIMLIFNSLFVQELPTSKGLSRAALTSMHYKLEHEHFQPSGSWITIRKTIEAEAVKLKIHLSSKEPLNGTTSLKAMSRRTTKNVDLVSKSPDSPSKGEVSDEVDWPSDSEDTVLGDDYVDPETPVKPRGRLPPARSLKIPGLISFCPHTPLPDEGAQKWKRTPRLVFRA